MADKDKKEEAAPVADAAPKSSALSGPFLLVAVNVLVTLAALGMLVYTKVLFKKPKITEEAERARIEAVQKAKPQPKLVSALIVFEPVTVNIAPNPQQPKAADGTPNQMQGKQHYITLGFAVEIRDDAKKAEFETFRPLMMDTLLNILGKKPFHVLATVQGRYVLKSELIDRFNEIWAAKTPPTKPAASPSGKPQEHGKGVNPVIVDEAFVTNIFFTQFIVQ